MLSGTKYSFMSRRDESLISEFILQHPSPNYKLEENHVVILINVLKNNRVGY